MKTAQELYNESIEEIQKVNAINDVSEKILEITDALYSKKLQDWSGDKLSRAIASLAVLRVNLGNQMADATAFFDMSYLSRKLTYANEWKPTKDELNAKLGKATIQDIDTEVLQKIAGQQEAELKAKHYAEKLRVLYDSTETLIMALQSRLGVLKTEKEEARKY